MRPEEFATLPESVQEYIHYLTAIKAKSQLTVLEYASDLRLFFRYVVKNSPENIVSGKYKDTPYDDILIFDLDIEFISKLSLKDAYAFITYCRNERGDDSTACARKCISIKRFYKFLLANNKIKSNPMEHLESPKIKKTLPKYLTLEQSLHLLECVDGKYRERDYCMLTLFLNCGLRLSELCAINISDIKDNGTLVVTGKGNKQRTIYINDSCASSLNSYLRVRPVDNVADKDALFLSNQRKRISPKTVQHIVKMYLEKAGYGNQGYSVHKLRHTAATLMYQHGNVDVLLLKEILGHENLSTTEIYTHVVNEQLRNAVDSNPLNTVNNKKQGKGE